MKEAEEALVIGLGYAQVRQVKCQVKNCPHHGGPFILPASRTVLILRYFCAEHWLQAVEGKLTIGIDIYSQEEEDHE